MGHYRSEMMSDYEIAYNEWKRERLSTMQDALATKTTDKLPLGLLGPVLRILGQMAGTLFDSSQYPIESDFSEVANHFGITLKSPPKKK